MSNQLYEISKRSDLFFTSPSRDYSRFCKRSDLNLLSDYTNIFKFISQNFVITTKNSSGKFNKDFLIETSPTIFNFIKEGHTEQEFHLDIEDPRNVLAKFEQLYQGKRVTFEQEDIPTCNEITELLFIICCPNYMKPENLRCRERSSSGSSWGSNNTNIKQGVEMKGISEYFKKLEFQRFTIITKTNKYKTNIFGVYFSDVIRSQIEKEPTTKQFAYDFEDESNEFKIICDLFNFENVKITYDNMDILKDICEDLQINCILNDINEFINTSEKVTKTIDDQQGIIDSIDELFDWLYHIKDRTVKDVKDSILQSVWIETEENVQELVAFLLEAISTDILLHPYLVDLICELNEQSNESNYLKILIPFLVKKLMDCIDSHIKQSNINSNFIGAFIYRLYKKGIIHKDELIKHLEKPNWVYKSIDLWFLPLIIEINNGTINMNQNRELNNFISLYYPDKMDLYEKMLDSGEPDDLLTRSIRCDDVDTLQSILSRSNQANVNLKYIPFNIYDYNVEKIGYLNYAAKYGSLKCFKYLLLNQYNIDQKTFEFAIYGGNNEIIKIVDQNNVSNKNQVYKEYSYRRNDDNEILYTIQKHRNDLFDWILDKKTNCIFTICAIRSAEHGNAHCLAEIIDKGFDILTEKRIIEKASENGFYRLAKFLLYIMKEKSNNNNNNKNGYNYANDGAWSYANQLNDGSFYASFGNLSIFQLFFDKFKIRNIVSNIISAVKNNYMSIINYFFEKISKNEISFSNNDGNRILEAALQNNNVKLFNYLFQKIEDIGKNSYSSYISLLSDICQYQHFDVIETITNIILKKNPDSDFSLVFNKAAQLGLNNVCQYLIDKKVKIRYNSLSMQSVGYGKLNKEIYSIILSNINPESKHKFLECIQDAIIKQNLELVDYLFKENAKCENALNLAVMAQNLDLVNIVLKYNNKPYLINKNYGGGIPLNIAIDHGNLPIVKRLLSIPGINPGLYKLQDDFGLFPLTNAIYRNNLDIINAILDFYGDDIQYQKQQLDEAMQAIFIKYISSINDKYIKNSNNILSIIYRILNIKYINPNYIYHSHNDIRRYYIQRFEEDHKNYSNENNSEEEEEEEEGMISSNELKRYYYFLQQRLNDVLKEQENTFNEIFDDDAFRYSKKFMHQIKYSDNDYYTNSDDDDDDDDNDNNENINNGISKIGSSDTFLLCACISNDINMVKYLLKSDKIDVNQYSLNNGDTPLITAVKTNNLEIAKLLIEHPKTDINHINFKDETAFTIAAQKNLHDIIELLLKDERFDQEQSHFHYAYIISNIKTQKYLLSSKFIKLDNDDYLHSFTKAVQENEFEFAELIINNEFFDKSQVKFGSIIEYIINRNSFQFFQLLYKFYDGDKINLFKMAVKCLNEKVIVYLLDNEKIKLTQDDILDSFVSIYSNNRITDLFSFQNELRLAPKIIRKKFKQIANQIKPNVLSILNKLYEYDKEHDHYIDFTKLLPSGKSFLTCFSFDFRDIGQVSDFLLEHGVDPNEPDFENIYPLEIAIHINSLEFARSLIKTNKIDYSAKIHLNDFQEITRFTTYLHLAISWDTSILHEFLRIDSIDINATDYLGNTPLMEACIKLKFEIINILFSRDDLDYLHRNNEGKDAIDLLIHQTQEQYENKEPINDKNEYLKKLKEIADNFNKKHRSGWGHL